jgi:hypothetical protein
LASRVEHLYEDLLAVQQPLFAMAILYRLMSGATEGEAQGQPLRSAG